MIKRKDNKGRVLNDGEIQMADIIISTWMHLENESLCIVGD